MYEIEKRMLKAIENGKDFEERNTKVRVRRNGFIVWLYDTPIYANICGVISVCDGGWKTNTTLSRLRALGVPYSKNGRTRAKNGVKLSSFNEMVKIIENS